MYRPFNLKKSTAGSFRRTPCHAARASIVIGSMLMIGLPSTPLLAANHVLSWFAGAQHANVDGPVSEARFYKPAGLAVDQNNNLFVADSGNHTIRRISPDGIVTTLAGRPGESGIQDGFGSGARFDSPARLAVDRDGVVYVCSKFGKRVQSVTPNGLVKTIADEPRLFYGNLANLAVDSAKTLYLVFDWPGVVRKRTSAGVISTYLGNNYSDEQGTAYPQTLFQPMAIAIDHADNLYVNSMNTGIVKISAAGLSSLFVDNVGGSPSFTLPGGLVVDRAGNGYLAGGSSGLVEKVTPDGKASILAGILRSPGYTDGPGASAQFIFPDGIAVDDKGNVFVTDVAIDAIRRIAPDGQVTTYAGTVVTTWDGPAESARFDAPNHIVADRRGNLFVAQYGRVVRKVDSRGSVSTVAGVATEAGNIDGSAGTARFGLLQGLAIAPDGSLFVSDATAKTIRKISPAGVVTTFAGGNGSSSIDGVGTSAGFSGPERLAVDAAGNVYVADHWVIRKVTPDGTVTTLAGSATENGTADGVGSAARFVGIGGLAVDPSGNLLVADRRGFTMRKVSPSGTVTTIAGQAGEFGDIDGKGSAARLPYPGSVVVDASGNAYVGTQTAVKKIGPDGLVTTLIQIGLPHDLATPMGLAIDSSGDLYLSGPKNAIWKISAPKAPPTIANSPTPAIGAVGGNLSLSITVAGAPRIQWLRNGTAIPGATSSVLAVNNFGPKVTGLYTATATNDDASNSTTPLIVGLTSAAKVVGAGDIVGTDIHHSNGNVFDQVLLTGAAEAITADYAQNQITRTSFIDLNDDIVQVEFSGPGTLSLVLDSPSDAPALPVNYNQSVSYMKGHAGIVITGATEQTNVSVFSVGRATAVNQALFKDGINYDGVADIAFIAIASSNGKFGGVRTANAHYFAAKGFTGLYAPGVQFNGPVFIRDITAGDDATPVLQLGSATDVRITGGDMLQANGRAVEVSGITRLQFRNGSDSHDHTFPAQANRAMYQQDGVDVTASIVQAPTP